MMKRYACTMAAVLAVTSMALLLTGCPDWRPAGTERTFGGIAFVWCPSGTFYMGSIEGEDDELPVHRTSLSSGFWMSKYEITQELWETIMSETPSHFTGDPRLPVENVSWKEVISFIGELNRQYPDEVFRLPTEAEWEYACRAGSDREYSFGDDPAPLPDYGWFDDNAESMTHIIGRKQPNAWGLYDMQGNVAEWVFDLYGDYPYDGQEAQDPAGADSGSERVYRGGSWCDDADRCRASARRSNSPDKRDSAIGFRLVME